MDRAFNETLYEKLREKEQKKKECIALFKGNRNTDERIITKAVLSYPAHTFHFREEKKERKFPVLFLSVLTFAGIFIAVIFILRKKRKRQMMKY